MSAVAWLGISADVEFVGNTTVNSDGGLALLGKQLLGGERTASPKSIEVRFSFGVLNVQSEGE